MIAHGQKEIFYDGYGFIKLDLETFSKGRLLSKKMKSIKFLIIFSFQLFQAVITYYLMFKTLITDLRFN